MEKRRFQRIPFDARITLALSNRDSAPIMGLLHDISLKGALFAINESYDPLHKGDQGLLTIEPEQGEMRIALQVEVTHCHDDKGWYGVNVLSLDVDSAAHLRRLVEVNLGDEESLQRELSNLISAMEAEHHS